MVLKADSGPDLMHITGHHQADSAAGQRLCPHGTSADTLFGGALICHQPALGYRFSVDAVLLAHFNRPRPGWRILDLGCGCGIIALLIARRYGGCSLCGLEKQPDLAACAASNIAANGLQARMQLVEADLRHVQEVLAPESFDLVVCNPPYYGQGTGRINQKEQVAQARHALETTLQDCIRAAAFAVKNRGRVSFIFPASSQARLQEQLLACRLVPKRLQMVYSYPAASEARLVLVEAMKNGGVSCQVLPPFYLYDRAGGAYSAAMQSLYQEEPCWPRS